MADARSRGVEVHPLLRRECLDVPILPEVCLRGVLDVVVQREDGLLAVADGGRADGEELLHHRRGVVMGHHVARPEGHHIADPERAIGPLDQMCLGDPLDGGLTHSPFSSAHPVGACTARVR
jgi:hypothetical protein